MVDSWELQWWTSEGSCIRDAILGVFWESARELLADGARTTG